jgi:Icc-related predicted phosphoesterase
MKLFFATDLHGSTRCFRKFVNAGRFFEADILIMGGDMCGKALVPVVEAAAGRFRVKLSGSVTSVEKEGLARLCETLIDQGYYPYITTPDEVDSLQRDPATVSALFSRLMVERAEEWVKLADERLRGTGIVCFLSPGNDDEFAIDDVLAGAEPVVVNPDGRLVELPLGWCMVSVGYSNRTPWNTPREVDDSDLGVMITGLVERTRPDLKHCIFNFHLPPAGTAIDQAPKLDETLKPVVKGGHAQWTDAGSRAVRESIERYQPQLSLHGHIHESRGAIRLGKTLCVNPGSEYGEGVLRGALLQFDRKSLRSHLLTMG